MDNSFSNRFQALEDNDREYDELSGTSTDGSSSPNVSYSSANFNMVINEDNQANNGGELGSSSSELMANSSSDKGSSEYVKASDNTSSANLSLNDEKGMDQDIQNLNSSANELGSSYSGSMAISSLDKHSSENVKVSDAMSQEGSMALVFIMERLHPMFLNESVKIIFEETLDVLFELMTDEYGHQVFTRLIDLLDILMIEELLGLLQKNQLLISVSLHEYGSISVKKLVEFLQKTPSIRKLTTALAEGIYTLLTHETGKHVVLKCFSILDFDDYEPIYEATRVQCVDIASHEVGCISLCTCMDFIKNPHRDCLLDSVLLQSTFHHLNSFSIHFLEYVIRLEDPGLTSTFLSNFTGYDELSMTREGSEFVRTCLKSTAMRVRVVKELVKSGKIEDIALDKFGNHVIQLALLLTMETNIELYWALVKALEPHMETLRYHPTGKVVYSSIQSER